MMKNFIPLVGKFLLKLPSFSKEARSEKTVQAQLVLQSIPGQQERENCWKAIRIPDSLKKSEIGNYKTAHLLFVVQAVCQSRRVPGYNDNL